jgi:hypothetical protein
MLYASRGSSCSSRPEVSGFAVNDVLPLGMVIAVISVAGLLAVASHRISERIRVPAPAIFLIAAAIASDFVPLLGQVPVVTVQRVVTVMLILLLFDGGMHIGWRRFRTAAGPVLWIGVVGTVVTAVGIAVLAHLVFGLDWRAGLLLGIALAPTDLASESDSSPRDTRPAATPGDGTAGRPSDCRCLYVDNDLSAFEGALCHRGRETA